MDCEMNKRPCRPLLALQAFKKTKACDSTDQVVLQWSYAGRVQILQGGKENNIFFKSRCKNLLFNFKSFLTIKGLFRFWRPITMKFVIVTPHQKFYPATLKLLNYFWLRLRRKCWKILNSLSSCDLVKIWCEGKFERLITKTNSYRRLAMILASKLLFLTDFGQKLDEQSSTMALPWQHWITQENNLYSKWKLISKY